MRLLYNIGIRLYLCITGIVGLFNPKAKLFHAGQKGLLKRIKAEVGHTSLPIIWVHCSSVGEFEQARLIIEWYKKGGHKYKILLTFFSPSGYELRKNYEFADWVYYLPIDTSSNAKAFVEAVRPAKAIFIKYEFWYNYLRELKRNNIETYIVAAIFRPTQQFFKWYGSFFRKMLECYTRFFVQDKQSAELLQSVGFSENVMICGDTRFDRVYEITHNSKTFPVIEQFAAGSSLTFVAGSSWEPDEEIIEGAMKHFNNMKLIIAPHEIGKERIASIEQRFSGYKVVKFSSFKSALSGAGENDAQGALSEMAMRAVKEADVLIIDCIGILSSIYRYGKFAYIGGGFGVGIHNILEAATYGCPVVFGPNHKKFKEAADLLKLGGATSVKNVTELYSLFKVYKTAPRELQQKGEICSKYVESNLGATQKIVSVIENLSNS